MDEPRPPGQPNDPDATVIRPSGQGFAATPPGPLSGPVTTSMPAAPAASQFVPSAEGDLPVGYRLEQFEVQQRVGRGGFSVVYKVYDHRLDTYRALKEYFPSGFAARGTDLSVRPKSRRDEEVFNIGLDHFVTEGRTLAKFDHPSLIRVLQTIEANGTAYMVMQLAEGEDLDTVVDAMPAPPDEAWLLKLLDDLTAALTVVHDAQWAHRDIKPCNVRLIEGTMRPVLLDFGAARQVMDRGGQPTGILTPGYAPLEQYPDSGLQQGPWTDVYALAASIHRLMTGSAPPNSLTRQLKESYVPLATRLAGRYSPRFLEAIDRCLAVDPEKRPRSMAEMRTLVGIGAMGGSGAAAVPAAAAPRPAATAAAPAGGIPVAVWIGAAVLGVVGVGAAVMLLGKNPGAPAAPAPAVVTTAPVAAPPAPQPAPSPQAGVAPAAPTADATSAASAALPAAVAAPPAATAAAGAMEPGAVFDRILQGADAGFQVGLKVEQPQMKVNVTPFRLSITSARAGRFYVLIHDTDREVRVLFPNLLQPDNQIRAGQTVTLPPNGSEVPFGEPVGAARLVAVVSSTPLDLAAATKRIDGDWKLLWQGAEAGPRAAAQPAGRPLYLGVPQCKPGEACDGRYGAAGAAIDVVR